MEMSFKAVIRGDVTSVFMNPEEFGEKHTINGKEILCIVDDNEMIAREKRLKQEYRNGVFKAQKLIYVEGKRFGTLPTPEGILTLDGKKYMVTDAVDEDGIYSINLGANRS